MPPHHLAANPWEGTELPPSCRDTRPWLLSILTAVTCALTLLMLMLSGQARVLAKEREGGRNDITVRLGHRALFDNHMPMPQHVTSLSRQEDQGPRGDEATSQVMLH